MNDEILPQEFDYTPKEEFDYTPKEEFDYTPKEEFDYTNNSDVDWDDEYEQTYCEEENNYEIIEEIDLFGNKIKKKVIRNNTN